MVQHCLVAMTEKWKTAVDKGGVSAALLTDLSKVVGCIAHDLIIAKQAAHGFDTNSVIKLNKLIHNFLSNRKQGIHVSSAYRIWKDIFHGVLQCSILEPLLFDIHLCEIEVTVTSLPFL